MKIEETENLKLKHVNNIQTTTTQIKTYTTQIYIYPKKSLKF